MIVGKFGRFVSPFLDYAFLNKNIYINKRGKTHFIWLKVPKIAIKAWAEMAMNMVNIGFHVKSYINVDHL